MPVRGKDHSELDLLAYIDGFLDDDPAWKAEVERRLQQSPEEAERARAYQAQTQALRRTFGRHIYEPVPKRLYAVLDRPPNRLAPLSRIAAVLVLLVAASAAGWMLGDRKHSEERRSIDQFVESSSRAYTASGTNAQQIRTTQTAWASRSFEPLAVEWPLTFRAPDLRRFGYMLIALREIDANDGRTIRLTYSAKDGERFELFVRTRRQAGDTGLRIVDEGDGVSVAYWSTGPILSAIASRLPSEETLQIARAVRRELSRSEPLPPAERFTVPAAPRPDNNFATISPAHERPAVSPGPIPVPPSLPDPATQRTEIAPPAFTPAN